MAQVSERQERECERRRTGTKRRGAGAVGVGILSGLLLAGSLSAQATEFIPLGFFPGFGYSRAYDVSADGSVVVGQSMVGGVQQAFLWNEMHGMRSLMDVLSNDYGLGSELTGWRLREATAISADGRHIVG